MERSDVTIKHLCGRPLIEYPLHVEKCPDSAAMGLSTASSSLARLRYFLDARPLVACSDGILNTSIVSGTWEKDHVIIWRMRLHRARAISQLPVRAEQGSRLSCPAIQPQLWTAGYTAAVTHGRARATMQLTRLDSSRSG